MLVEDVDPKEKGWVPLESRAWMLPDGSYFTFPANRPEKLAREVDEDPHAGWVRAHSHARGASFT